jgi:hypothetical protein
MHFRIEGSKVCLAGTMHCVRQGHRLAPWVNYAIDAARLVYIEHEEDVSRQGQVASPWTVPLARQLPCAWSRIERQCRRDLVVQLKHLRPRAVVSYLLEYVPLDSGVEHHALAKSRETHPPKPRIEYLETIAEANALDDGVSNAVWDEAVGWALDNPASSTKLVESSYEAWIAGDFEAIDRINSTYSLNRFEAIKEASINARNRLWLPRIRQLVTAADDPTLVLVGAAHLGGAGGLLRLLTACGLKVSKIS